MAGMTVVVVKCDAMGNVDMDDLKAKCEQHSAKLAAVMITYPSTHGVFEVRVKELCALVHQHGGRVYVDGANMNALVGVAAPGEFGGDVSHLNLHKTFCIPHGGGGPGVGPVAVVADLVPFLPAHRTAGCRRRAERGRGQRRAAGQCRRAADQLDVLPHDGRRRPARRHRGGDPQRQLHRRAAGRALPGALQRRQRGLKGGGVAHECILDMRPLAKATGIGAEDVAKRLIDYGFHAPTLSFPVAGTLMVEPTESEPLAELDRFCDAMIAIRAEIAKVEAGLAKDDNPLKNAPHTAWRCSRPTGRMPTRREQAAYPLPALRRQKYWAPVGRVDNVWGDRNLFCSCPPMSDYAA
jgi:glycine dehydrogenase